MMTKDKAKEIRKKLKEKGINSRQVSVRSTHGSIRCDIKDLTVSKELVEDIAQSFEHVRRCERTNEILSGGNTFVFVSFDWQAMNDAREPFMSWAQELSALTESTTLANTDDYWVWFEPGPSGSIIHHDQATGRQQRYAAHNPYAIADALTILTHQKGIDF